MGMGDLRFRQMAVGGTSSPAQAAGLSGRPADGPPAKDLGVQIAAESEVSPETFGEGGGVQAVWLAEGRLQTGFPLEIFPAMAPVFEPGFGLPIIEDVEGTEEAPHPVDGPGGSIAGVGHKLRIRRDHGGEVMKVPAAGRKPPSHATLDRLRVGA